MRQTPVCLDARMYNSSGIGTYLQGLLTGLRQIAPDTYSWRLLGDPKAIPAGPWTTQKACAPIYSIREQIEIPRLFRAQKSALLHAPHYNIPVMVASRTVVTVHDVIHLKFPQFWPSKVAQAYANFFLRIVLPRTRAILTVSQNTKRDLIRMLGIPEERITVTYPAVDHARFQNVTSAAMASFDRLGLFTDYLLYVGNLKPFKNVERLVNAYRQLRETMRDCPSLVIAGRNFIPGFEQTLAGTPGVRWIGEVDRDLLACLYRKALLFVFPSLYEGFGLPPLEAMASGTPVLCSNRASLPEVVGDAAMMVDPENAEALTVAMKHLIDNSALRKDLSAKGVLQAARFSWKKMAAQTLEVYQRCLI